MYNLNLPICLKKYMRVQCAIHSFGIAIIFPSIIWKRCQHFFCYGYLSLNVRKTDYIIEKVKVIPTSYYTDIGENGVSSHLFFKFSLPL